MCGVLWLVWSVCCLIILFCFFFKQKTAYEMRISDWSSDVCSSDLDRFRLLRGSSMARHCIREPRYVPPVQRIGEQPDLFGGPTLSHVAERQGPPKGWQRQLQKWGRCTVIADLEAAPPSVIDPPPSPSPVFLVACVAAKLDRPAPARDLYASPWFQKARAYVERQGGAWFILSAKHGLTAPETSKTRRNAGRERGCKKE